MNSQKKKFKYSSTYYRKKQKLSQEIQEKINKDVSKSNFCGNSTHSPNSFLEIKESLLSKDLPCSSQWVLSENLHDVEAPECLLSKELPCSSCCVLSENLSKDLYYEFEEAENIEERIELEKEEKSLEFGDKIRDWALRNSISHKALNELLGILPAAGIRYLPRDSRTLLQTPKNIQIKSMGSGHLWYYGVRQNFSNIFVNLQAMTSYIKVNFHVDGIPVNDSSRNQFWPILMKIVEFPYINPMVVAIYCGDSKPPTAALFFSEFVAELKDLLQTPMKINGQEIKIQINAFICDTPARCFSKCVVSFNAYGSCHKCTVKGKYHTNGRHMSFPQTDCAPRTDEAFRQKVDKDHHLKDKNTGETLSSPLELLPIDMIRSFPVADSLHLLDLGIMKRCLNGWVNGSFNFREKFFGPQIESISKWLEDCNMTIPNDIHRAVRGLKNLSFWKGTEYRTFLLYLGPVILKHNLSTALYRHYLLLFTGVTICSCKYYIKNPNLIDLASELLRDYIELFITNYGEDAISSNVHNLCHLVEDVKNFGPLPEISSYCFENKLGTIMNLIRSGNRPLVQVAKRLTEISILEDATKKGLERPCLKHELPNFEPQPTFGKYTIFKTLKLVQGFDLIANQKNQWFMTKEESIVKMLGAYSKDGLTYIYGCKVRDLYNLFSHPLESKHLSIYKTSNHFGEPENFDIREIKCKLVMLKFNEELIFFPLIHTLDLLM